jgi:PPM family protein phosphatase
VVPFFLSGSQSSDVFLDRRNVLFYLSFIYSMKYQVAGLSDVGVRRKDNQDAYLIDKKIPLFVVCDGVGGHSAGAIASSLCIEIFKDTIERRMDLIDAYRADPSLKNRKAIASLLQNGALAANYEIHQKGLRESTKSGMATTLVSILMLPDFALITHVGDSRAYLLRAGKVHQLTEDHQFGVEMISAGQWTEEQSRKSPHGNVLTRAVGMHPTLKVDTLQVEILSGDQFLLCTDGFYRYTNPDALKALHDGEPAQCIPKMIEFAKRAGGEDNITVIALTMEPKKIETKSAIDILQKTELMTKVPLFRFMNFNEIAKILSIAEVKFIDRGEIIVKEGDPSLHLFIIAKGTVEVLHHDTRVTMREKGDVIGEMGVFDKAPRAATLKAESPTYLIQITQTELLNLFRKEQLISLKFIWALNGILTKRLRAATQELAAPAPVEGENTRSEWVPFAKD